jgi:hypothetical protein
MTQVKPVPESTVLKSFYTIVTKALRLNTAEVFNDCCFISINTVLMVCLPISTPEIFDQSDEISHDLTCIPLPVNPMP